MLAAKANFSTLKSSRENGLCREGKHASADHLLFSGVSYAVDFGLSEAEQDSLQKSDLCSGFINFLLIEHWYKE